MSETNKRYVKWRIKKAKIIVLKFKIKGFRCFIFDILTTQSRLQQPFKFIIRGFGIFTGNAAIQKITYIVCSPLRISNFYRFGMIFGTSGWKLDMI